jgi:hypothetical protein
MTEHLDHEDRALKERIFPDKILVVPEEFPLERRGISAQGAEKQQDEYRPIFRGKACEKPLETIHGQRLQS